MGTYNLIQDVISLKTLNVAERLEVLDSLQGLLLAAKDSSSSGSEPGQPSVQAETGGVEALGVSEEQMTKLADYVAIFTSATYQTRRNSQTDELAAVDAERCRIVKYMVEKSLNWTRATTPASRTTRTSRRPSNPTPKPPTPSSRIPKSRRRPIPRRRGQGRRHRRSRMIGRWCSRQLTMEN